MFHEDNGCKRFYVDVVGLELKANYRDHYAQVGSPGVTVGLHPSTKDASHPAKSEGISIGFGADDLTSAMNDLKAKGAAFSRVVEDRPTKLAFFTDQDGNPLFSPRRRAGADRDRVEWLLHPCRRRALWLRP